MRVFKNAAGLFVRLAQLRQHVVIFERRRVLSFLAASGDVSEQAAHDFHAAGLRQRGGETDLIW